MASTTTPPPKISAPRTGVRGYDAFVSYSHAADGRLAPALQAGLQSLAKPWHRRRALRVFRDKTSLSASPELWPAIEGALSQARFFVLLASPEAAASHWVEQEVRWWRAHRSHETILIALTDGELRWDDAGRDFDAASAIPPGLRRWFPAEPLWVDLRWARDERDVSMRNPRFRDSVGEVAAPLHGLPKDELIGEDISQHRRALRLARSAVALLVLLLAVAVVGVVVALIQRNEAREARDVALARERLATSRQLSTEALQNLRVSGQRSLLQGLEALAVHDTMEARNVVLRAVQQHSRLTSLQPAPGGTALAYSPDARLLAAADQRGRVTVWDVRKQETAFRSFVADRRGVYALAFSRDGQSVITGGGGGNVLLWNARTGAPQGDPLVAHGQEIWTLAMSPDGEAIASSGDDNFGVVWDLASRRELRRLTSEEAFRMRSIAFSPDGQTLASGDWLGRLRWWDRPTGRLVGQAEVGGGGPIGSVGFQPQTHELAACSTTEAAVHSFAGGSLRTVARLADIGEIGACAVSPSSPLLAVGRLDGTVVLWNWGSGARATLRAQSGRIAQLAFAPTARSLAALTLGGEGPTSDGDESTIAIWDLQDERGLGKTVATSASVADVSVRRRLVAAGHHDGTVSVVEGRTGRSLRRCGPGFDERVAAVAISADARIVAMASDRGEVAFCATSTGARIGQPIRDPNEFAVTRIEVTPNGATAFWSGEDRRIVIWDRRARRRLASKRFFAPIDAIGVGPDDQPTVTVDGTTWVWREDLGRLQPDRSGRDDRVDIPGAAPTAALALGGRVAAVAVPQEPHVRLWDLDRQEGLGRPLLPPDGAETATYASDLSFAEDGRALAATYDTGAVVLWDTDPRSWAARACDIVRPLVRYRPARLLPGQELRKGCLPR